MPTADPYELLDFGAGRKLERFGPHVLDRPCPAAEGLSRSTPELWNSADARFHRTDDGGSWSPASFTQHTWQIQGSGLTLELKATPFGHVGLFAEQANNWSWIGDRVRAAEGPFELLHLFAHTGSCTLAAAAAGARVVHVDSAANVLRWARRNAHLSGLDDAPIRWIGEDAEKFVRREVRRKNHYQGVILDPPSFGRGPKGQVWKLDRQLLPLLQDCFKLLAENASFLLLTCHSPGWDVDAVTRLLRSTAPRGGRIEARATQLTTSQGRALPCGTLGCWVSDSPPAPVDTNPGEMRRPR